MAIVKGEGVILKFLDGSGVYTSFACARSITLNLDSEMIGKSTVGSGKWKESEVVALSWNFTLEGIIYLDEPGMTEAGDLISIWQQMVPVAIEFFIIDTTGNEIKMSGLALLSNVTTTGSVNNVSSFNASGEGTSELLSSMNLLNFRIVNVVPGIPALGSETLTFSWDLQAGATSYDIQIENLTTGATSTDTGITGPPHDIVVTSNMAYRFALRAMPGGDWSSWIYYRSVAEDYDFRITAVQPGIPVAGQETLTFGWSPTAGATSYTIRVNNISQGTTVDDTGIVGPPHNIVVFSGFAFRFALRVDNGSFGSWIYYRSGATGGSPVTSWNGMVGDIIAFTDHLPENPAGATNLYWRDERTSAFSVFHGPPSGGGTLLSASNLISWSQRFIIISMGTGPQIPDGHFGITFPPDGTIIHGLANKPDYTVAGGKIELGTWDTLFYALPLGASNVTNNNNFYRGTYGAGGGNYNVPSHFVAIAKHNSDTDQVIWINGSRTWANTYGGEVYVKEATINTSLYVRSNGAWTVLPAYPAAGISEAPQDSQYYSRRNAGWAVSPAIMGAWTNGIPQSGISGSFRSRISSDNFVHVDMDINKGGSSIGDVLIGNVASAHRPGSWGVGFIAANKELEIVTGTISSNGDVVIVTGGLSQNIHGMATYYRH